MKSVFKALFLSCVPLLFSVITAQQSTATPTRVLKTDCIWSGNNGKLFKQKCSIYGNSSAGFGTTFRLTWEDGLKTVIHAKPGDSQFLTPESKRRVETHGTFEFDRMLLPRQIHIEGLGLIVVTYKDYSVSRKYVGK
ncbi:hypothetical protein IQ266_18895 [filamentous cyanobacterium LEGE 11480]|uniref:Uncharacterized protein n=1 Tax=Romeriopsis navalis LEGE 11480 TaxID=2777977 RepID=A0A928VNJ9_9CYAN|nr:hypothetical protein [Romeriopsis navalis]MBE9031806.1 hypothetical protein [Romeriopsis navalis LEGE 11480]